jgi:succinate dehydrogenase / fumarate reductase membrane anchor subunit
VSNLRTPLGRVLGSGSAREGTEHFWAQRLSAMALVVLGLWFLTMLCLLDDFGYASVVEAIRRPVNSILLLLFSATLAFHSSLGVQVIIEDYVHGSLSKIAALVLSKFAHVFVAVAAAFAVLRIAFGSP